MNQEELIKLANTSELTEDLILKLTQETRRSMLVAELTEGVPTGKNIYRMLKLLEDMDATALNVKKIDTDDDNANADRNAALMIASMNKQLDGLNPFQLNSDAPRVEKDITPSASDIPVIEPKLEENAVGISSLTYEEFTVEESIPK